VWPAHEYDRFRALICRDGGSLLARPASSDEARSLMHQVADNASSPEHSFIDVFELY
jgi:hypothetical protein